MIADNSTTDLATGTETGVNVAIAKPRPVTTSRVTAWQRIESAETVFGPPPPPKWIPPKRPNIVFLCMHKAASTFVADVLMQSIAIRTAHYDLFNVGSMVIKYFQEKKEEYGLRPARNLKEQEDQLRRCLGEWKLPTCNGLISRVYPGHMPILSEALGTAIPGKGQRMCVIRRDPRDALISLYYSMTISHSTEDIEGDPDVYRNRREDLRSQDLQAGLKMLFRNEGLDCTTREFIYCTDLLRSNKRVCDLPYELLMNDPEQWLKKFVRYGKLQEYVDNAWTGEMLGHLQPPEIEDPGSHKRRMRPGNWVDVFDDELKDMMQKRLGSRMAEFGYHW